MNTTPIELLESLANDAGVRDNPYPSYRFAQAMGEVLSLGEGFFIATSYRATDALLRSPKFLKNPRGASRGRRSVFNPDYPSSMLFLDPPDHTRLRRSVSRFFLPSAIARISGSIGDTATELITALVAQGGGDVVELVSVKLPIVVIASMLGVSACEGEALRDSVSIVARSLDLGTQFDEARTTELAQAGSRLLAYFSDLIANDSQATTMLAQLQGGDDPLSARESAVMAVLLFMAGFETTSNLISSMVFTLCEDDDVAKTAMADEADLGAMVEEFLRLESPVQLDGRIAGVDSELGGVLIPEGSFVMTLIGAANRDAEVFSDPDVFSPARSQAPILSFGAGIHHCLGSNLARTEAKALLGALRAAPRPKLVSAKRKPSLTLRGFESLVVEF